MISFRVLGTLSLRRADSRELASFLTGQKRVALLSYLVLASPRGFHRRDTLLSLFWPELDTKHARASLRNMLFQMRRGLGGGVLVGRGNEEIGLAAGALWCDAVAFEEALDAGRLAHAVDLYRGDLLRGFFVSGASAEFDHWRDRECARFRRRATEAARTLIEQAERHGDAAEATRWARRAVRLDPLDEEAVRRLVALLDESGDPAGALRAYERFAGQLASELDAEPAAETRELVESIRARTASTGGPGTPAGPLTHASDSAGAPEDAGGAAIADPSAGKTDGGGELPTELEVVRNWRAPAAALVVILLIVTAIAANRSGGPDAVGPALADSRTLAALPFRPVAGEDARMLAGGLHQGLLERLATVPDLQVVSRASVAFLQESPLSLPEIGRELGAGWLVQGDVRHIGNDVSVDARLVNAGSGRELWAQIYRRSLTASNLFAIQTEMARAIARALEVELTAEDTVRLASVATTELAAYELHLQAQDLMRTPPATSERLDQIRKLYSRAAQLDSTFAEAWAGMAYVHTVRTLTSPHDREVYADSAIFAARRALVLDPALAAAYVYIGTALRSKGAPIEERIAVYRRALDLQPTSPLALNELVVMLSFSGQLADKMMWLDRARRMAPGSTKPLRGLAGTNGALGRDSLADAWFALARQRGTPLLREEFHAALYQRDDPARAREILRELSVELPETTRDRYLGALALYDGDWREARLIYRGLYPSILGSSSHLYKGLLADGIGLAYALQRLGQLDEAREIAGEVALTARLEIQAGEPKFVPRHRLAAAHLLLGDTAAALGFLEESVDAGYRGGRTLRTIPVLNPLRDHPGFRQLLERVDRLVAAELRRVEREGWGIPEPLAVPATPARTAPR